VEVDLEALRALILKEEQPLRIAVLAGRAVKVWQDRQGQPRKYAPGATYPVGEHVLYQGQVARVESAVDAENPVQGAFQVVALALPDGSKKYLAAGVRGAPTSVRPEPSAEGSQPALPAGLEERRQVEAALEGDTRFVWVPDNQGGIWCLSELLVAVSEEDVRQVQKILTDSDTGSLNPVPSEAIVESLWGSADDGSSEYRVFEFSLEATLQRYQEFEHLPGDGWVLSSQWSRFRERPPLISPRQPNVVPPARITIVDAELDETEVDGSKTKGGKEAVPGDFIEWQEGRLLNAQFTLSDQQYYGAWLPLTKELRRVLPPSKKRVTFHHQFGAEQESFDACVDAEEGRILGDARMYDAFRDYGIYPGARLVVSHRGNLDHYDIRTKPVTAGKTISVRKLELDGNGILNEYVDDEPMRYEIDPYVFIASARWEDIPALFRQADEIGKGIFQLMYEKCSVWTQERGAPLRVTAQELFQVIHFDINDGRLTTKSSIEWELWKRRAFESVGNGYYQFRPEYGSRTRLDSLPARPRNQPVVGVSKPRKDRRLGSVSKPAPANWFVDEDALAEAVAKYMADPLRPKILFLRAKAHEQIRRLLAEEQIDNLSLATFNRDIWQIGSIRYKRWEAAAYSEEVIQFLQGMTLENLEAAYAAGDLAITGNQTWGSGTQIYGPQLTVSDTKREHILQTAIRFLLYGDGSIESRLESILSNANGLGINVVSGILHASYPDEHILYNGRSVQALESLGISWPSNWRHDASTYVRYANWCRQLLHHYNFADLTDVDWFLYSLPNTSSSRLDHSMAYVLGLAVARGSLLKNTFRIHLDLSSLEAEVSGLDNSALAVSYRLLKERLFETLGDSVAVEIGEDDVTIEVTDRCATFDKFRALVDKSGSMKIPDYVFEMSRDNKVEFARGIADAAGYVRRAQYYRDGRIFVFFQLRQSDWLLPTAICRLFQLELGIPVSFIIWGHPNIRNSSAKSASHSWAKEHQLKVFCDAFEEIGFFLPYKQRALETLAKINHSIGKPLPPLCHPNKKRVMQAKVVHPDENSERLPTGLRGNHYDSWWQICLDVGCPFADGYIRQGTLFGTV